VHDLGDRSSADTASIDDALSDRVEQRTRALKGGRLATRHHQEVARLGTLHSAADRRVEHCDTPLGEHPMNPSHQRRGVGRVIDVEATRLEVCDEAARSEAHQLHLNRPRQAGGHHLAIGGQGRW
jgi:hypothetical protein